MDYNTVILNIITDIVKEEGISKLILNYKKRLEWVELILEYTYDNKIDWSILSKKQELSEDFIHEYKDKLNWLYICIYQTLSESFIENHKHYILWRWISKYQKLTQNFIHKYKEVLNWDMICTYQRLSSRFIEKHRSYVKWLKIANHQSGLSAGFLIKHKNDIRRDLNVMEYYEYPEDIYFPDIQPF